VALTELQRKNEGSNIVIVSFLGAINAGWRRAFSDSWSRVHENKTQEFTVFPGRGSEDMYTYYFALADATATIGYAMMHRNGERSASFDHCGIEPAFRRMGLYGEMIRVRMEDILAQGVTDIGLIATDPRVDHSIVKALDNLRVQGRIHSYDVTPYRASATEMSQARRVYCRRMQVHLDI
jgi:hypothetical protein